MWVALGIVLAAIVVVVVGLILLANWFSKHWETG